MEIKSASQPAEQAFGYDNPNRSMWVCENCKDDIGLKSKKYCEFCGSAGAREEMKTENEKAQKEWAEKKARGELAHIYG